MPSRSFLLASGIGAIILGLLTGAFGVRCGSRYGETEKRYAMQGVPALVCTGILLYLDWRNHVFWSLGMFNIVYFLTPRLNRLLRKRKKHS